jgi:radical SAM protein with 4Fe4S-binding SPASM domain
MTVTIHNVKFLSKSVRELHEMGFKSFSIIPDADCGAWTESSFAQYESEMSKVFEYWAAHREIEVNTIEQTIEKMVRKKIQPNMCQVGRTILGITIDGDIYPCHDFSGKFASDPAERHNLLIGNVEKGFTANQHKFSDLPVEKARSGNNFDCSTCWAKWACGRGCPYMNYTRAGDVFQVNSVYCSTTRINATLALRWMSILDGCRFLRDKDIAAIRLQLSKAVLNAGGGEEEAPFGRNKEGRALLPSPMKLRELGFDPWPEEKKNGSAKTRPLLKPGITQSRPEAAAEAAKTVQAQGSL